MSYLLAVQTSLIGLEDNVPLPTDVKTRALDLLDAVLVAFVFVCVDNLLHLCWSDLDILHQFHFSTRMVSPVCLLPGCASSPLLVKIEICRETREGNEEGHCNFVGRRTLNPDDVAHTLLPSELKMAALSTLPVPSRL